MRRFFNILLGALAMLAVALVSAFVTMRLAIHGREVEVPSVAGLTLAEANSLASQSGLSVSVDNRFYSTVTPAGRVLSQYPSAGAKVRREWALRVTESLGPQNVTVPNVVGKTEREASVTIRRLSLDLGTVAYLAAPGQAGVVLAQTPTPAAAGIDGPRISLLVSEPIPVVRARPAAAPTDDAADTASTQDTSASSPPASANSPGDAPIQAEQMPAPSTEDAFVMPNLVGLTLSVASARVTAMGLHITSMETQPTPIKALPAVPAPTQPGTTANGQPAAIRPIAPMAPITLANTVVAQSPPAGRRVTRTDVIRIVLTR
jgi:beta-lactam-binding protein with PASTA domain